MESSFQTSLCKLPDIAASTLAVDSTGKYALICGRKNMALVDLDGEDPAQRPNSSIGTSSITSSSLNQSSQQQDANLNMPNDLIQQVANSPRKTPVSRRFVRNSKHEPTACQFNRQMADLFALTTYQVVELYSINDLNPQKPGATFKGHSRAIADIDWSHFDPYMFGSSAADCLTNLWDIRDSRRPSATLTSVCGATQVRFSKTSSNLMATCHEIDVRIWDIRQQNLPLYYIAAHLQKINGMDWNASKNAGDQEQLITCSQDNTIKLWDLNANKIKPSANFPSKPPAWRVRYTPVSPNALLTSTLPQLRSRNECLALKLWSMKSNREGQKELELILALTGHTDVIIDFDWRPRPSPSSSCEIVSWSRDQTLRVWRIDKQFIELNTQNSNFESTMQSQDQDQANEATEQAFIDRSSQDPPEAGGRPSEGVDAAVVHQSAEKLGTPNLSKITPPSVAVTNSKPTPSPGFKTTSITLSAQRDHSVPFPPTSGARFCGNLLVCFGRPLIPTLNRSTPGSESANWSVETPRSMAQLSAQLENMRRQGSYNLSHISISYFYYGAMRRAELQQRERSGKNQSSSSSSSRAKYLAGRGKSQSIMSKSYKCGPVLVYDVTDLIGGLNKKLAETYVFDKDVIKMCRRNAEISAEYNRKDLVQIWSWAQLSSEGILHSYVSNRKEDQAMSLFNHDSDFGNRPWTMHPFGSKLIQSLIDHYVNNCHDVQTAAMLVWTFSSPKLGKSAEMLLQSNSSKLENSAHPSPSNYADISRLPRLSILSLDRALQNDLIMHIYAEHLYRLNLLNQRAMVLKNIGLDSAYSELFNNRTNSNELIQERLANLTVQCSNTSCYSKCQSVQCHRCKMYSLFCSICRLPVKGSCAICLKCLHGGHVNHFNTWFNSYDFCPTGCGCECLGSLEHHHEGLTNGRQQVDPTPVNHQSGERPETAAVGAKN